MTGNVADDEERREHLLFCVQRAQEYVDLGRGLEAARSLLSDLKKHPSTASLLTLVRMHEVSVASIESTAAMQQVLDEIRAEHLDAADGEKSAVVVRLLRVIDGRRTSLDGGWLVEYDPTRPGVGPNGEPMAAHITVCQAWEQARRFAGVAEAHAYVSRTSGAVRPDGRPDRPLTAYSLATYTVRRGADQSEVLVD